MLNSATLRRVSDRSQRSSTPLEVPRLTFPRQLLGFSHLLRCHHLSGLVAVLHGASITFRRREIEPHMGADMVHRDALTCAIHQAEVELRRCKPLRSSSPLPLHCFCVVLQHTFPFVIHHAEVGLRLCIPLSSS